MSPVNPSERTAEERAGWLVRFLYWSTATVDRRMIVLWMGWASLSWIMLIGSEYIGLGLLTTSAYGLIQQSTVFALAAFAALVKPQTPRYLGIPVLFYVLFSVCTISISVIQCAVSESHFSQTPFTIFENHVASFGYWIWFGVVLYLVVHYFGLCVTRQPPSGEVLTVNKLFVATSLAAAGFAMQRFSQIDQFLVIPDEAQLVFMLETALPVALWLVVLWTQICSRRMALFLIVLTIIGGVCMGELLHAALWSRVELKDSNVKIGHQPLWEQVLSWLTAMLGVWVAIRIARVGGYQVRRTSAPSASDSQTTI